MIDLRFYHGNVQDYITKQGITDLLVLYSVPDIAEDRNIHF